MEIEEISDFDSEAYMETLSDYIPDNLDDVLEEVNGEVQPISTTEFEPVDVTPEMTNDRDQRLMEILIQIINTRELVYNDVSFTATRGVPQGGLVSPTLFNLVMEDFKSRLKRLNAPGLCLQYADDTVALLREQDVLEFEQKFELALSEVGISMNREKTQTLSPMQTQPIKYLGSRITYNPIDSVRSTMDQFTKSLNWHQTKTWYWMNDALREEAMNTYILNTVVPRVRPLILACDLHSIDSAVQIVNDFFIYAMNKVLDIPTWSLQRDATLYYPYDMWLHCARWLHDNEKAMTYAQINTDGYNFLADYIFGKVRNQGNRRIKIDYRNKILRQLFSAKFLHTVLNPVWYKEDDNHNILIAMVRQRQGTPQANWKWAEQQNIVPKLSEATDYLSWQTDYHDELCQRFHEALEDPNLVVWLNANQYHPWVDPNHMTDQVESAVDIAIDKYSRLVGDIV